MKECRPSILNIYRYLIESLIITKKNKQRNIVYLSLNSIIYLSLFFSLSFSHTRPWIQDEIERNSKTREFFKQEREIDEIDRFKLAF